MRSSIWWCLAVFSLACSVSEETAEPPDALLDQRVPIEDRGPGIAVDIDTRRRSLAALGSALMRRDRHGPNFSLLDGEAMGIEVSNYSAGPVGEVTPGMVRVRFQVRVWNRLSRAELVPPMLPADVPAPGVLMLLPLLQQANAGQAPVYTGNDASIIVDREHTVLVRPSEEWNGGGALGSSGYDFVRGATCIPSAPGCSRWEAYAPLAPGGMSSPQTVGFDVAPTVGSFRVRLLLSANLRTTSDQPPEPPPVPGPGEWIGVPFGPFHLPASALDPTSYSGLLRAVVPEQIEATLDSVARRGGRIVLAVSRSRSSNADNTFNLTYWKWELDRYRLLDLDRYIANGTILGLYIIDEPDCGNCWGGVTISPQTVDEMARFAKTIWPNMPTIARVVPGFFDSYGPPEYLDVAWAQYEGPLHVPSHRQTPEQFRDAQVADAARLGLGLVFGSNALDGGDGSSGMSGTIDHSTRFQMSVAEYERAGKIFAAEPYACAVIDWRYSSDYPEYDGMSEVLPLIRAFHGRPEVVAASQRIAAVARNRTSAPCRRR